MNEDDNDDNTMTTTEEVVVDNDIDDNIDVGNDSDLPKLERFLECQYMPTMFIFRTLVRNVHQCYVPVSVDL